MTPIQKLQKFLLAFAIVIVVVLLYINWDKIKSLFGGSKVPADGTACSTTGSGPNNGTYINGVCTLTPPREGSACVVKGLDGTIIGGVCVQNSSPTPTPQPSSNTIKITNANGARVLAIQGGKFVSLANAPVIPAGTTLTVIQVISAPHTYYNTSSGWIDGNDASVV